jgi:hypothetical protein
MAVLREGIAPTQPEAAGDEQKNGYADNEGLDFRSDNRRHRLERFQSPADEPDEDLDG